MNARERFLATMHFEPLDRPLYWEFGYWVPTIRRWYKEGLEEAAGIPQELGDDDTLMGECLGMDWRYPNYDVDVHKAMGFDRGLYRIPVNNMYCPPFEPQILEETDKWYKLRDSEGQLVQVSRINGSRKFLEFPVTTRQDYYRLREERLAPNLEQRLSENWSELKDMLKHRTFPLMYGGNLGFFNHPRRLVGLERLMTLFYDDPDLVRQMINDTVDLLIAIYDPVLSELPGDCAMISEDMCYKTGCFISPAMFREFMLPAYHRLVDFYRGHGMDIIYLDTDGDVTDLIPLLMEAGVTGLHPFEVTGRCDIVDIRKAYPRFQIMGGVDKKKIAMGRQAIDEELERKIPFVFEGGGFIPFIDHTIPPEVSWDNFCYYRRRLSELARH